MKITYTGDARGALGAIKTLEDAQVGLGDKLRQVGQRITSTGKSLTKGLTLPIVAFGAASVKAFSDAQKVTAQTEAVLKSTGGAAGVTAAQVSKLATRIQNYSGMSDEAVASGQNLLLTFTKVRNEAGKGNDIFTQSTTIMADMSVALGQDMKSSAIQLGKALNDPIKGVTALQRVGVSFTEAQRTQIAAMVESGNVMGAQKLILAELTTEFGGSAKAIGETAAGQWDIAKEKIGNAMETIGKVIVEVGLPIFEKLSGALQTALDWFNKLDPGVKRTIVTVLAIVAAVGPVLIVFGKLVSALGVVVKAFGVLSAVLSANPYVLLIAATVALVILIVKNWDTIKEFLLKVWEGIKAAAKFFWDHIAIFIIGPMKLAIDFVIEHWREIKEKLGDIWRAIRDVATTVWNGIAGAIKVAINIAITAINVLIRNMNRVSGALDFLGGPGLNWGDIPEIPHVAHGGIVRRPTLALVGEAGPEAIVPLSGAMGAGRPTIVVNAGLILTERDLTRLIRNELIKFGRRNVTASIA